MPGGTAGRGSGFPGGDADGRPSGRWMFSSSVRRADPCRGTLCGIVCVGRVVEPRCPTTSCGDGAGDGGAPQHGRKRRFMGVVAHCTGREHWKQGFPRGSRRDAAPQQALRHVSGSRTGWDTGRRMRSMGHGTRGRGPRTARARHKHPGNDRPHDRTDQPNSNERHRIPSRPPSGVARPLPPTGGRHEGRVRARDLPPAGGESSYSPIVQNASCNSPPTYTLQCEPVPSARLPHPGRMAGL